MVPHIFHLLDKKRKEKEKKEDKTKKEEKEKKNKVWTEEKGEESRLQLSSFFPFWLPRSKVILLSYEDKNKGPASLAFF